ncbi:hypothetical protein GC176_10055 [bacterium]|nr:hypothetical protein [bacterium]
MDPPTESCGPQHLDDVFPSESWGTARLGQFAATQHCAIARRERALPRRYWRLGRALDLARDKVPHGEWNEFLEQHGIEKTRASKARAIYRSFDSEGDVTGLSVEEAYDQRTRKFATRAQSPTGPLQRLTSCLDQLVRVIRELNAGTPCEDGSPAELHALIECLVQELMRLQVALNSSTSASSYEP